MSAGVGVAVGAFVVGVVAVYVSRAAWRPAAWTVPWGMLVSLLGSVAVVVLARSISRAHGFAAAAGWLLALFLLLSPRREGDYLIADDALGWAFIALGTVAVISAAAWGSRPR